MRIGIWFDLYTESLICRLVQWLTLQYCFSLQWWCRRFNKTSSKQKQSNDTAGLLNCRCRSCKGFTSAKPILHRKLQCMWWIGAFVSVLSSTSLVKIPYRSRNIHNDSQIMTNMYYHCKWSHYIHSSHEIFTRSQSLDFNWCQRANCYTRLKYHPRAV